SGRAPGLTSAMGVQRAVARSASRATRYATPYSTLCDDDIAGCHTAGAKNGQPPLPSGSLERSAGPTSLKRAKSYVPADDSQLQPTHAGVRLVIHTDYIRNTTTLHTLRLRRRRPTHRSTARGVGGDASGQATTRARGYATERS